MHKIPRTNITIDIRQRSDDFKSLREKNFRTSIETHGLFHPIVVEAQNDGTYRLLCGGRRLANIDWMAEDNVTFYCDREAISPGEVPVTFLHEMDEVGRAEVEFDENFHRAGLTWQDEVRALDKIHKLRVAANPKQSVIDTARQLNETANVSVGGTRKKIAEAQIIVEHLADPAIEKARNANEAYGLVVRKQEATYRALLIQKRQNIPSTAQVIHGDSTIILPTLDADVADLILCDPPYAIDAGASGFRSRTVHHHNYADTIEAAQKLIRAILLQGFRVCKPRANIFIFCDIGLWDWIQTQSQTAGWTPFRTPVIWMKSESEGLAPWGGQGFRRTYELIFYATKGQKGLLASPVDILDFHRVSKGLRDYGPAKPTGLMKALIECSTIPGDLVIDPCCGSGATVVAALETNRRVIGIEKDQNAFNLALAKTATDNGMAAQAEPRAADL